MGDCVRYGMEFSWSNPFVKPIKQTDPSTTSSAQARAAAHQLHAKHDSRDLTQAAREEFMSRFHRQVDPQRQLDPRERERRAQHAKKAYYIRLGQLSGKARRNAD